MDDIAICSSASLMYIESPYIQSYVHIILLVLTAYSSVECLKLSVSYSNKQIGTPYHQISISSTTNYCHYTWRSSTYGDMVSLIPVAYSRTGWLKLFVSYGTERYGAPNFFFTNHFNVFDTTLWFHTNLPKIVKVFLFC